MSDRGAYNDDSNDSSDSHRQRTIVTLRRALRQTLAVSFLDTSGVRDE